MQKGTVTKDITKAVKEAKQGVPFKKDKTAIVHVGIGKVHLPLSLLHQRFLSFFRYIDYWNAPPDAFSVKHYLQVSFQDEALCENVGAFVHELLRQKPAGLKKSKQLLIISLLICLVKVQ